MNFTITSFFYFYKNIISRAFNLFLIQLLINFLYYMKILEFIRKELYSYCVYFLYIKFFMLRNIGILLEYNRQ